MSLPPFDKHATESFRRFYLLLPRDGDTTLLILKLHLLVEEQVRAYVDQRLASPKALDAAKLECHQAICLAEALCNDDIHENVWEAARKLNGLRNHIAHSLEPKGVSDRMDHISSLIGLPLATLKDQEKTQEQNAADNLSFAVSMLYNEIALYVRRRPAQVVSLVPPNGDA
jgi:hypothetical protein